MIHFLPGFSIKNRSEVSEIANFLTKKKFSVKIFEWDHWVDSSLPWTPDIYLKRIIDSLDKSEENIIVAKSLGTLIAIRLLENVPHLLKHVVLMGIPYLDLTESELEEYVKQLRSPKIPIDLIHNRFDNHGGLDKILELFQGIPINIKIQESDNHSYNYPEEIFKLLQNS